MQRERNKDRKLEFQAQRKARNCTNGSQGQVARSPVHASHMGGSDPIS